MKKLSQNARTRRQLLLLPLVAMGSHIFASAALAADEAPDDIKPGAEEGCPLNSGGPSLLDSK
jgi:hypothetical protein